MHKRRGGKCLTCPAERITLHRDHIVPKWKGGTEEESNIQYICANCHEDKTREDLKGVKNFAGKKHTEEWKKNMSRRFKGMGPSPETVEKIRKANTGKKRTEEVKAKIALVGRGRKISEHQRAILIASNIARGGKEHAVDCSHCIKVRASKVADEFTLLSLPKPKFDE